MSKNQFYLDYLDYLVGTQANPLEMSSRLKFDLLIFTDERIMLSVPACVKMPWITDILFNLDDFWLNGVIRLQLDSKHKLDPMHYFNNRKQKLERAIDEEDLIQHFEYEAYISPRVSTFYDEYISSKLSLSAQSLYVDKQCDTDSAFRKLSVEEAGNTIALFEQEFDVQTALRIGSAFADLCHLADESNLFQRSIVHEYLTSSVNLSRNELHLFDVSMDRAFARANALSTKAIPISFINNRATSKTLIPFLRKCYPGLYDLITNLPWSSLYRLGKSESWRIFLGTLNALLTLFVSDKEYVSSALKNLGRKVELRRTADAVIATFQTHLSEFALQHGMYSDYCFFENYLKNYLSIRELTSKKLGVLLSRLDNTAKLLEIRIKLFSTDGYI